jgi:hypothetical protein
MKTPALPLTISGHDVLGEILRRNKVRVQCEQGAKICGVHTARLGTSEEVESNLPIRKSPIAIRKSSP